MKKLSLVTLLLSMAMLGMSQTNAEKIIKRPHLLLGLGNSYVPGIAKGISTSLSPSASFGIDYPFYLSGKHGIGVIPNIEMLHIVSDGAFFKNVEGQADFTRTPEDYKNNRVTYMNVSVPVYYQYFFGEKNDDSKNFMSLGLNPGIIFAKKHHYKVGNWGIIEEIGGLNKLKLGMEFRVGQKYKKTPGVGIGYFAAGLKYDLLSLTDSRSFRTLNVALYIGF